MTTQISIQTLNYFGELEGENFNAKVRYTKNGKSYVACIYLDFFWKKVYFPKQIKGYKVLSGLDYAIKLNQGF